MTHVRHTTIEQDTRDRLATLEADLQTLARELDHATRLATLGTIAAGVAHEVNNLLTPALAYAQLAQSSPDDPAMLEKALSRTVSGIEAASRILESMLDFSSSPQGDAQTDVGQTLDATLDLLARHPAKDRITLVRRIVPGTRAAIQPLALQQVLANLLLNARRALCGRGGEIVISAERAGDGYVLIHISDNGPGIPPEIADSLFEPFVSAPIAGGESAADHSSGKASSGLGLAVCRRIIEAAGGTIAADSAPGRGATFTLRLPAGELEPMQRA
jgi:two-component system NtrC family sensor kinase